MVDGEQNSAARAAEPAAAETSAPTSAAERALCRDDVAAVLTGVAAGLGRYTRIDPVVWRTAFAVTALGGGTGVWLYAFAWLLMRDARGGPAMAEQLFSRRLTGDAVLALLGCGLAVGTAFTLFGGFSWTTLVLAVPLVLGCLVAHNRGVDLAHTLRQLPKWLKKQDPPPSVAAPSPAPAYYHPGQSWTAASDGPVDLAVLARQATEPEAGQKTTARHEAAAGIAELRPQERNGACSSSRRGGVGLFALVVWGALALTGVMFVFGGVSVDALLGPQTAPLYLGGIVTLCGAVLILGAWVGNPRGIVPVATLATVLAVGATATDVTEARFGSVTWRPTAVAEIREPFELTAGQARLDLTRLPVEPGQEVTVRARVGLGSVEVIVPDTVRTVVRGQAGIGWVTLGDQMFEAGLRVDVHEVVPPRSGPGSNEGEDAAAEVPTLNLIVDSCAGNLEVSHVTA